MEQLTEMEKAILDLSEKVPAGVFLGSIELTTTLKSALAKVGGGVTKTLWTGKRYEVILDDCDGGYERTGFTSKQDAIAYAQEQSRLERWLQIDVRETVTTENEIDWWTGEPEPEPEPDLSMLTVRLPELD